MENRKLLRNILVNMALLIMILSLPSPCLGSQWIYFHDEEIKGYVVDAESNRPIESAIVVALWQLSQIASEGFGGYAKVIEVKTDKKGKFLIPSWKTFKPWKFNSVMHELAPIVIVYKPGYKFYWFYKGYKGDYSETEEAERKRQEVHSMNPTKLQKVSGDEDRLENYYNWGVIARFPDKHFSKEQSKDIFGALEEDISDLSKKNLEKNDISEGIKNLRESWAGGRK